ncbi:PD-(D/E)XK nuclease family protein [Hydrogenophaga sp.]|uniref:PD-(D/E)XK nuclease family protein n=1 Tax=Hydrogenophaga sp. TaxID=1904254 RepID=UPI00356A47D1
MTTASKNPFGDGPIDASTLAMDTGGVRDRHVSHLRWDALVALVAQQLAERGVPANRVLILVPYAQLMDTGRRAWARAHPNGFAPRLESSRNWASTLQPHVPSANDLSGDMARDSLVASSLLGQVVRGTVESALRAVMVSRLLQAARQLGPLAAAQAPEQRLAWAEGLRPVIAPTQQALHWEALLASVALAWVSTSAYATDVLWSPLGDPGAEFDLLVVVQGFQQDPLATALARRWGERAVVLDLHEPVTASEEMALHACADAEDEALRSAACVIAHANAGRVPVALVANDRLLTRRVSAVLHGAGLAVRDETGWKLSTTQVAARLMSLLRAADPRARTDEVLDFLKQGGIWPEHQVAALEQQLRQTGVSQWHAVGSHPLLASCRPAGLSELLSGLQAPRPLVVWLADVRRALQTCGWWDALVDDAAGAQLVQVLRLADGAAHELAALSDTGLEDEPPHTAARQGDAARSAARMGLSALTAWVREVLEAASFTAPTEQPPAVVILPMAQMLGRAFAATVAPGCDERHLPTSPDLPGQWTLEQREALGLPSRETVAGAARQAWCALLAQPALDLLWRAQDNGEDLLPNAWLQSLLADETADRRGADPRTVRTLLSQPSAKPTPSAPDLMPQALSASAYQDLRDCPYRFFAMRQLRLQPTDEIEAEPDKRDMGIWLHAVLKGFHEQRAPASERASDLALLDQLADSVAQSMGLHAQGQGGAGFLPFQAAWPAMRDGYLAWLAGFEAREGQAGPRFSLAEQAMSALAGPYKLVGKLDRIDLQDSPEGAIPFVIDYKTEPRKTTLDRVKQPLEDTQIAFYAALQPQETLRAAYLSISESREAKGPDTPTRLVEQTQVLLAREHLLQGLVHDLDRVRAGHTMPALGEGRVCEFCAARGLCRKDFWSAA